MNIRLKYLLLDKKMTITKLSEITGINRVYLSRLANNRVEDTKLLYLELVTAALQCSYDDLLGENTKSVEEIIINKNNIEKKMSLRVC